MNKRSKVNSTKEFIPYKLLLVSHISYFLKKSIKFNTTEKCVVIHLQRRVNKYILL